MSPLTKVLVTEIPDIMTETPFPDKMNPLVDIPLSSRPVPAPSRPIVPAKNSSQLTTTPRLPLPEVKVDPRTVMLSHYGTQFLSIITPDILWPLPDATIKLNKPSSFVAKELFIPSEMQAPAVRGLTEDWLPFVAINLTWCNVYGIRKQVVEFVMVDLSKRIFPRQSNPSDNGENIPSFLHNDLNRLKALLQGKTLETNYSGKYEGTIFMEKFVPALAPSMSIDGVPMRALMPKKKTTTILAS